MKTEPDLIRVAVVSSAGFFTPTSLAAAARIVFFGRADWFSDCLEVGATEPGEFPVSATYPSDVFQANALTHRTNVPQAENHGERGEQDTGTPIGHREPAAENRPEHRVTPVHHAGGNGETNEASPPMHGIHVCRHWRKNRRWAAIS